ncbi:MAG: SufS family cysteine desulfurase [Alphaproteobacteria bacterium]|nr:SufS family cysteine desulfurase [Alphaproteobacteria bacterium]
MYDIDKIRRDFPVLQRQINGKPDVYLDSAASAQKPKSVINKMNRIYRSGYANVHRGTYALSDSITNEYEKARKIVQKFINARSEKEVVFTRNATESINLVAATWAMRNLKTGDEILISEAEHHANLIPWQIVGQKIGAVLKVFKIADDGGYIHEEFQNKLSERTKLVAVTGMSNVLGTLFPIKQIASEAHKFGAKVLIDACQLAVHARLDVQDSDCDFLAFSGHKTYGPTGIGVLYGKTDILADMPPYQTGGDMVDKVTYEYTTYAEPPARFEAGTPAIVEAIGLGEALKYMQKIGFDNIERHEREMADYMLQKTSEIKNFKHIGTVAGKGGVFSFQVGSIHPQDLAYVLGKEGVAIRIGHHCAEPLVNRLGYTSLARASLGLYTSKEDIDAFVAAVKKAQKFFD